MNRDGLFCHEEGYCVCGNGCFEKRTMAEVLSEHYVDITQASPDKIGYCVCGYSADPMNVSWEEHQADALSAAGFGLVADAKAEAWDEGFASGKSRAMRAMSDEPSLPLTTPNPYRAAS